MPAFRTTHSTGSARPSRTFAGAAAVALAALALTACQNGTGTKDEGAATTSGAATSTPSAGATGKAQGGTSGRGTPGAAGQDAPQTAGAEKTSGGKTGAGSADGKKTSGAGTSAGRVLCNGSNTRVTVRPVTRPLNHMLITVKNIGSKTCDLTYYPILRFDEMQWAPSASKDSQPQAVVTLRPGESGYAGVTLSAADGSGEGGDTGHRLVVAFQGLTPNSDGGASAVPSLPAKGAYYDSSLTVTYWQQTMADALKF